MASSSALARVTRATTAAACAALVAGSLLACGGGKDADPAKAVPASAPFYAELTVRPDGELKTDAEAGLKKLLGTDDVSAEIAKIVKSASSGTDFEADIEPWLGSRIGLFATSFAGTNPQGAAVIASKDNGKAKDFVAAQARSYPTEKTYNDVDYRLNKGGDALGVVGDYVVNGTERGFRTAVDTIKGDDVKTIDTDAQYQKAIAALGPDDAVATAYISTKGLIDAAARSGGLPPDTLAGASQAAVTSGGSASAAKLGINAQAAAFDTVTLGLPAGSSSARNGAAAALAGLPGDAWFGVGIGNFGDILRNALQQVTQAAGSAGADIAAQLDSLQEAVGLDLDKDLFAWMGDLGVFVKGTALVDLGGALVIQSKDPAASARAVTKIGKLVKSFTEGTKVEPLTGVRGADTGVEITPSGFPFPIVMAAGGDKFVVGARKDAVESALQPSSTVADSASFKRARAALAGVEPQMFIDVAPISRIITGLGVDSDPTVAQIMRYLSHIDTIAAGSKRDGTTVRAKLVVTLKG